MKKTLLSFAISASLFAANAYAEPSAYVFGALGQSSYKSGGESESDTSFGLGGGYSFNENFSIEARYDDFGELEASEYDGGSAISAKLSASAMSVGVVASVPFSETFSAYGKLGLSFWDVDGSISSSYFSGSSSESGNDFNFGLGAQFSATENVKIGAEYNMLNIGDLDLDINTFSVFAKFHF